MSDSKNFNASVSVIMSVHNDENYLNLSIKSILNQEYSNFEFLIIDDASTDSSLKIIEDFSLSDSRIRVFKNKENQGLTKNLNFLIKNSKGDYIARMDADDISFNLRLKKQVKFLNENPNIDILGTKAIDVDENGKKLRLRSVPLHHNKIIRSLPFVNPMIHPSVIFRMVSIKKVGGYNEKYKTSQDYFYWFYCQSKNLTFANLDEALIFYRMDNNYGKRKSLKYRINDMKLKFEGFKITSQAFYKYILILLPIFVWLTPISLFSILKRLDPREI